MCGVDGIFASEGTAKIVTAVASGDRQFAQRAFGTIRFWIGVSNENRCLRQTGTALNSNSVAESASPVAADDRCRKARKFLVAFVGCFCIFIRVWYSFSLG